MTEDGWGKAWLEEVAPVSKQAWDSLKPATGVAIADAIEDIGKVLIVTIPKIYDTKKEHNNKVPTHDPYTNPNAHIYYECKCGKILDPGTKRFAELNNCASSAGWKIRFTDTGYVPYCVDCGKGVE